MTRGPCRRGSLDRQAPGLRAGDDICAHPLVCGPVAGVLRPDLAVWNSVLMNKAPGDGEMPWHQDQDFDYLSPDTGLAVWLAIDDATGANGCLEVVPGSHHTLLPSTFRAAGPRTSTPTWTSTRRGGPGLGSPVELRAGNSWSSTTRSCTARPRIPHRAAGSASPCAKVPAVEVDTTRFFDGYRAVAVSAADSAPPPGHQAP